MMLVVGVDPCFQNGSSWLVVPAGKRIWGRMMETLHVRRSVGNSPPVRSDFDLCSNHPHRPTLVSPVPHLF